MNRKDITIFVGPICNLADARFYAAFEFDFLLFDFRVDSDFKVSLELFNEIKEWVTGVEFACISNSSNDSFKRTFSESEYSELEKVQPNQLSEFSYKKGDSFLVDISSLITEPVKHYDMVADWYESKFEEY